MVQPQSLTKLHGLGNDFLVALESGDGRYPTDDAERSDAAVRLCARRRGIGADGLIFGDSAQGAVDLRMSLFNVDGSRAEISGNGIRCLAHAWAIENATTKGNVSIATDAGLRTLSVVQETKILATVRVEMGSVTLGEEVPEIASEFDASSARRADVGNPHVVLWFPSLEGRDPTDIGQSLENRFDGGMNVHLATVDGSEHLSMLHWERGVGITEACGSGATVAAAIAADMGEVGEVVEVAMPGGSARIELGDPVVLVGPSELIGRIEVAP